MSVDKDGESVVFAMVDANLDTNPKIRKAGSFGRQVFEFVLRRNALRGSKGSVPIAYVDPDYLADQLMIASSDAVTGVTKAVTAKLIEIDEHAGLVHIVGWHPSWGRRPKEGKERTREWRERNKAKARGQVTTGDDGDATPSHATAGDESDVVEKRREEKREREEPSLSRLPDGWEPDWSAEVVEAEAFAKAKGVALVAELAKFRAWARAEAVERADWNAAWVKWLITAWPPTKREVEAKTEADRVERARANRDRNEPKPVVVAPSERAAAHAQLLEVIQGGGG